MGWRDPANVIPFIVIDGSGNVIVDIEATGIKVFAAPPNGSFIALNPVGAFGGTEIDLQPANVAGVTYQQALFAATNDGTAEKRPQLVIDAPNITGKNFPTIVMVGQGVTDLTTKITLDGSDIRVGTGTTGIGRGNARGTAPGTSTGAIGAETVTDTISNFLFEDGRVYSVQPLGRMNASVASIGAVFRLRKGTTTAGALILDFGALPTQNPNAVTLCPPLYIARATGVGNLLTNICMTLGSTAGTVTWIDGANCPRGLLIKDEGNHNTWEGPYVLVT